MILALTLLACSVAAVALVYRYDLYDREPLPLAVATIAGGAAAMAALDRIETASYRGAIGLGLDSRLALAAIGAVEEELGRLALVLLVAVLARRHFDDPMDGLVYGSLAGLGMAVEEAWHFSARLGAGAVPAEIVRILGHLVFGGITGFAVGLGRVGRPGWPLVLAGCFAASAGLHFAWDWIALTALFEGGLGPLGTAAAVVVMTSGLLLYGALTALGSRRSRERFAPRSRRSLWGWPFVRRRPGGS